MTQRPTFRQRWQYSVDHVMSRGTPALIGVLALFSAIVVLVSAIVISLGGLMLSPAGSSEPMGFVDAAWESLMRTFDPGTMGGDQGWGFRFVMLFVTLGGIFVVSALIGVLNNGLETQIERLRKGRSRVLENGHTIILGWSPQIFTIISELMIANENQPDGRIVILANRDKIEMEDEIRERVAATGKTRVICRSGSPIDLTDLEIASPHMAGSIIILPPETENPDSHVIKTVLALTNNPNRRPEPYLIVTQISDPKNMDVIRMIGQNDEVHAVLAGDLIARVVAQTSRQSGLSAVYTELLNFGGDEIYFQNEPRLVGKTYGEALLAYEDSCVMGLKRADGSLLLNPPMELQIETGDQIFALSEDDDTVRLSGLDELPIDETQICSNGRGRKPVPEKTMLIGWNRCAATIIREMDHYVPKKSEMLVIAEADIQAETSACAAELHNQKLTFRKGDPTSRKLLETLNADEYDHVIVLSNGSLPVQEADSRTLVTLLHLRDIAVQDDTPFSLVSEMLDLRNRQLAEVTHVDDFVVSDHLVSLMMAQLSENSDLYQVFNDLFDPDGSEIYLKPARDYVKLDQPASFYTVVESARRRGETAIGYRLAGLSRDASAGYGIVTNPRKSDLVTFAPEDKVVVLAKE
ncbi:MAG: NAD-binding protein [Anaerolineales bacterium]|nr:NAD-binding protein [Anaerolineales bacterium]